MTHCPRYQSRRSVQAIHPVDGSQNRHPFAMSMQRLTVLVASGVPVGVVIVTEDSPCDAVPDLVDWVAGSEGTTAAVVVVTVPAIQMRNKSPIPLSLKPGGQEAIQVPVIGSRYCRFRHTEHRLRSIAHTWQLACRSIHAPPMPAGVVPTVSHRRLKLPVPSGTCVVGHTSTHAPSSR